MKIRNKTNDRIQIVTMNGSLFLNPFEEVITSDPIRRCEFDRLGSDIEIVKEYIKKERKEKEIKICTEQE